MAEEKIRKGYLAKYANYKSWFMSHDEEWQKQHMLRCKRCGRDFIPDSPNQKYCSEDCFKRTHEPCTYNGTWVNKINMAFLTPAKKK